MCSGSTCCRGDTRGPTELPRNVAGVEVLGFPETESERKPLRNVQTDFIKIPLEHSGGSTEEREAL